MTMRPPRRFGLCVGGIVLIGLAFKATAETPPKKYPDPAVKGAQTATTPIVDQPVLVPIHIPTLDEKRLDAICKIDVNKTDPKCNPVAKN